MAYGKDVEELLRSGDPSVEQVVETEEKPKKEPKVKSK